MLVDALAEAAAADAAAVLPPEDSAVVAEATLGDLRLATRLISLALQPLVWLVNAAPASLKPIFGGFLLFVTPIAAFVGAAIDSVLDPILRLFGIGVPIPDPPAPESVMRSEDTSLSEDAEAGMTSGRARAATQDRTAVPDVPEVADIAEATDTEEASEVPDTTTPEVVETEPEPPAIETAEIEAESETVPEVEEAAEPEVATEPEIVVESEGATDMEEAADVEESTATDESVGDTTTAAEPSDEETTAA
ncbi:hypothetical protein ACAG25_11690 [Mycobacterium sp. pV006]|uniref:hypothetical protein n=1 Tax=Mycobacterium sp. pV006 TaxID=3238983 RepID=UPI00351BAFB7